MPVLAPWWKRRLSLIAGLMLGLAGPLAEPVSGASKTDEYRQDRLLVRPSPAAWAVSTEAALAPDPAAPVRFATAAELAASASPRAALHAKLGLRSLHSYAAFGGLEVVELPPEASLEDTRRTLAASGLYAYVEHDHIQRINLAPNDPSYADGTLWGLNNTGQSGGVSDADIDAPEAWDIRTDASSVVIAVIDTGIRTTHQDLAANLWANPGESGGGKETNGIDDDGNGYIDDVRGINAITGSGNPADDHGHGSHCAGTIGGSGNDGAGVAGVAWRVKLMGLKFLGATGSGTVSDAIECINYARAKGAKILSNSWGGGGSSTALYDAIAACRTDGILFVAAAGNSTRNTDAVASYPSSYELDNIVSVAATDRTDALAAFSNRGFGSVQLGAPGVAITSSVATGDSAYASYSGTSMATPHVSGALALMRAQFPSDTYAQLINRLLRATDPIPSLAGQTLTGGRLNVFRALTGTLNTPLNDAFASRLVLPPNTSVYVRTSNLAATSETGEPLHATIGASRSVWFSWTSPTSSTVSISLAGSDFDTILGVYTGSSVTSLTELVGNDNASAGIFTSRVTFNAVGGVAYRIAVDGKASATGTIILRIATAPVNDAFARASALNGASATVTATNSGASREPGEPAHADVVGGASVWWSWTAPVSDTVNLSTAGSYFNTLLAVYTGSSVDALTLVASNDDAGSGVPSSNLRFNAVAGVNYRVAVDGKAGASGSIRLSLATPPTNDLFANRIALPSAATTTSGNNIGAGREAGEPTHGSISSSASVWWTWTAPFSGTWEINTIGSDYDTLLGVYTGYSVGALTTLATNDDSGGNGTSRVVIAASAGTTYQIAVDGWNGDSGVIQLAVRPFSASPNNDAFSARTPINLSSNGRGGATGNSATATKENGEPDHAGQPGGRSVWWTWTAAANGFLVIDTNGSDFDTLLAAYSGSAVSALTEIVSNDNADGFQSRIGFTVTAGSTYAIAVDGAGNVGGTAVLSLSFTSGNQRPAVTAATLSPAGRGYADAPVVVTNLAASDLEGDPVTFTYQWQSAADGYSWADESGETDATLAPAPARAGRFWRCAVRARDSGGAGAVFTTAATGLENRAPAASRHGDPYRYDPALPIAVPPGAGYDRPVWINEFSQGQLNTTAEWIELLVLRATDLRGYSLRDVNSSTSALTFGNHILWGSVPAGSVIVVYNASTTKDPLLPADDTNPNDKRLLVPGSTTYFSGSWPLMSNTIADGIVVRDADGNLADGFSINDGVAQAPSLGPVASGRAAQFLGATTEEVDSASSWSIISAAASALTPGAGNNPVNTALISNLRAGTISVPRTWSISAGALPAGLALDPATGVVSGIPDAPAGGFFTFTVRLDTVAGLFAERSVQLLIGDSVGVHRVPVGVTWTLTGDTTLAGALVVDGTVVTAGHTLSVARTYAAWAAVRAATPGELADPLADPDRDGQPNLVEFALGADPAKPDAALVRATLAGTRPALVFRRQVAPRVAAYAVEWSSNLTTWNAFDLDANLVAPSSAADADGYEQITVRAPDAAPSGLLFLRLVVSQ